MAEVKEKKAKAKPEGQGKGAEGKEQGKKVGKEKKPKLQSVLAKKYQGEVVPKLIEKFG